jgi:hypothetical protein
LGYVAALETPRRNRRSATSSIGTSAWTSLPDAIGKERKLLVEPAERRAAFSQFVGAEEVRRLLWDSASIELQAAIQVTNGTLAEDMVRCANIFTHTVALVISMLQCTLSGASTQLVAAKPMILAVRQGGCGVPISRVFSYLVHPSKLETKQPLIKGADVPLRGKLFDMLSRIDEESLRECDIEIMFRPQKDGAQQNDCRDLLLAYLANPSLVAGHALAARLQSVTTKKSGLGLLFIIVGKDQHGLRLIVCRFPAEPGVMAEESGKQPDIQYLEKVFMKNVRSYKSVLYRCKSIHAGFWDGVAVDRQMIDTRGSADYWIREFLASDLRNTAAAGTKRIAVAVQNVLRDTEDPVIRQELVSAAQLMCGQNARITSAEKIVDDMALSPPTAEALKAAFPRAELYASTFKFDADEFNANLLFRSVELDNGAMLIAENGSFDKVIKSEASAKDPTRKRFTTEGAIIDERLRKTR